MNFYNIADRYNPECALIYVKNKTGVTSTAGDWVAMVIGTLGNAMSSGSPTGSCMIAITPTSGNLTAPLGVWHQSGVADGEIGQVCVWGYHDALVLGSTASVAGSPLKLVSGQRYAVAYIPDSDYDKAVRICGNIIADYTTTTAAVRKCFIRCI